MTTRKPRGLDAGAPTTKKKAAKKKTTKKKAAAAPAPAPASVAVPQLQPAIWRSVVFTDLHLSAKTLDRGLRLLGIVREVAKQYDSHAVCCGDFWDLRQVLAVRHLDAVKRELDEWEREGVRLIIVPGNHDQVTMDGSVNAVSIFDAFPHVTVATEPFIDPEKKLAFIPWREREGEQEQTFAALAENGGGWTIFAHAEVEGAIANSGKAAGGRVKLATIESAARACYLGHYHRRQQLGACSWYIGSPFEMNFGERDEPHGIAIVDSENVEPVFLDLDEFPKHHRFTWPGDAAKLKQAREQDIVELYMPPEELRGASLGNALSVIKAKDVRPLPLAPQQEEGSAAPPIALTLAEATKLYVHEWAGDQMKMGVQVDSERIERLVRLGREFISSVPDARTIAPLAPVVRITGVEIDNFCNVRGHLDLSLEALGPVLLRGPMGIGKTSICDAITWCVHGATTPRKPGDRGGTLRADDVIHDLSEEVRVVVTVQLPDKPRIKIERTKKRGQGAKLRLYNADGLTEGISDTQEIVHRIVGLDLDLWRATVYLGQGAVANFVTDADKKRKELLSRAFGLGACEPALKAVREALKKAESDVSLYSMREAEAQSGLDTLAKMDFAAQSAAWEQQKEATLAHLTGQMQDSQARIAQIDPHLVNEAAWIAHRDAYNAHVETLTKSLAASSSNDAVAKLSSDLGAAEAELGLVQRELNVMLAEHRRIMEARDSGQAATCNACGQALPGGSEGLEQHLDEYEQKIASKRLDVQAREMRAFTLRAKLDEVKAGAAAPDQSALLGQLKEARDALAKCTEALTTIARMRDARQQAQARYDEAAAAYAQKYAEANPWAAKAAEVESARQRYQEALTEAQGRRRAAHETHADLSVWEQGFSAKGLPVLVLRTVLYELETHANAYLASLLGGRVHTRLVMDGDDLSIQFFEFDSTRGVHVERSFYQLSGGQRRCVELAFSPFALSEMIFSRCGVRVRLLIVDELTTHLDPDTKPLAARLMSGIDRETVLVIDHDAGVQGEFDVVYDVQRTASGTLDVRRAS